MSPIEPVVQGSFGAFPTDIGRRIVEFAIRPSDGWRVDPKEACNMSLVSAQVQEWSDASFFRLLFLDCATKSYMLLDSLNSSTPISPRMDHCINTHLQFIIIELHMRIWGVGPTWRDTFFPPALLAAPNLKSILWMDDLPCHLADDVVVSDQLQKIYFDPTSMLGSAPRFDHPIYRNIVTMNLTSNWAGWDWSLSRDLLNLRHLILNAWDSGKSSMLSVFRRNIIPNLPVQLELVMLMEFTLGQAPFSAVKAEIEDLCDGRIDDRIVVAVGCLSDRESIWAVEKPWVVSVEYSEVEPPLLEWLIEVPEKQTMHGRGLEALDIRRRTLSGEGSLAK